MRVVFVTATRADFGKLKPVILALQERMDVRVFVTGMHMLSKYGSTYREVLRAGVSNPSLFRNQRAGDPMDYVLARTIQGLGDYLKENEADLVVVHGDRVEAMAGALAGALHNILVVHIEGGEVSGTVDEHLRHAVTKLAHIHLVANEEAKRRVIQLGERPEAVHVTGSPDLDAMSSPELPTLDDARERYDLAFPEYGICIFHPVTTEVEKAGSHARELMGALDRSGKSWVVIFPNNDHGSEAILEVYGGYRDDPRFSFFPSIRFEYFLTLMKHCRLMVGNSSAGVREIPFYGRYAIDVGTRQRNRGSSSHVVHAQADEEALLPLIREYWGKVGEPASDFGDGKSTERILRIFERMSGRGTSIQKVFKDIPGDGMESIAQVKDLQSELREVELRLVSRQLEDQYETNMRAFEAVLPEAYERLKDHWPQVMHLNYDDRGFVNLVNSGDGSPVYGEDPKEAALGQVAHYLLNPKHLKGANQRATVLDEADNAHLSNANGVIDLLLQHPQEQYPTLPDPVNFMLMLGVGLGYHLEALLQQVDIRHLCIVEPEVDVFQASAHTLDWLPILERFSQPGHSFELILGKDPSECSIELEGYLDDIGSFQAVVPFVFDHLSSERLSLVLRDFIERILPQRFSGLGYFDDEQVGLAHSLANYRKRVPVLQEHISLSGAYLDRPAFIVANGPSLDEAVDFLRENQDRGVVFSCGTALGSLAKAGILPDFHVEMERSRPVVEWITQATTEEDRAGITLLGLNTVHPEVFDLFPRHGMAMKPNDGGTRYLARFFRPESQVISLPDSNPTVANAALSYATAFGFSEMYLFGLDLGFPAGDRHHSELSKHYDVKEEAEHTLGLYRRDHERNVEVPGNRGGMIVTTPVYMNARWSVEKLLAANPRVRCFNASGGALIRGAAPVELSGLRLEMEPFDKGGFVEGLFRRVFSRKGLGPIREEYGPRLRENLLGLLSSLGDVAEENVFTRAQGMESLTRLHEAVASTLEDREMAYAAAMLKGSVASFSVLMAQALHRKVDARASLGLFRVAQERFRAFLDAAKCVVSERLFQEDSRSRNLAGILK